MHQPCSGKTSGWGYSLKRFYCSEKKSVFSRGVWAFVPARGNRSSAATTQTYLHVKTLDLTHPPTVTFAAFHENENGNAKRDLTHLLLLWHKHLLGLLDHGLRLELVLGELVFAGVKEFTPRHAGEDQVGGVGFVVDVHLHLVRTDGLRRGPVLRCDL